MTKKDCFFEKIYNEIKYRSIHKSVYEELSEHIDEAAAAYKNDGYNEESALSKALEDMGSPEDIGKAFNKQYSMPFNHRYGLVIWFGLITCFIYTVLYPILSLINNGKIEMRNSSIATVIILAAVALVNYLVLRRGHFIISGADVRDISVGFLIGASCSLIILFLLSLAGKYGYYIYCSDVKILFFNPATYMGNEIRFCGDELLIWLSFMIIYSYSCKINTKQGFVFAKCLDSIYPYCIDIDENDNIKLD